MRETILKAGCKVNLYLAILGRRPDGYHELRTLFLPLPEPSDRLLISPMENGEGLLLSCTDKTLETDSNILAKTYRLFAEATGFAPALSVRLEKTIPMGAGLGGGSSDAAALLMHLNGLAGPGALPEERLGALAARLGADVPFFLQDKPAWAEGIGERLEPADVQLDNMSLLLACPDVHVPTAWAYRTWDDVWLGPCPPGTRSLLLTSHYSGHKKIFCPQAAPLYNSFESVVFPAFPELRRLKESLYAFGAAGVVMSGSGAAVCALFRDRGQANAAAKGLRQTGVVSFVHQF